MDHTTSETAPKLVYVRPVDKSALPDDIRKATKDLQAPYALHAPNGDRLAIVGDQRQAFVLARQNDFHPVRVVNWGSQAA